MDARVRPATASDRAAIAGVIVAAFGAGDGPEIAQLAEDLERDPSARPLRSLVATVETAIVGHVLFTKARLDSSGEVAAAILAPLSVRPECQHQGIGRQLATAGLDQLRADGVDLIFVLGYPSYYRQFGFSTAGIRGFDAPYPLLPEQAEAWMVRELQSGAISGASGRVLCAGALADPKYWRE